MGLAPRPGVSTRQEAADRARRTITLTMRGESHTFAPGNVPMHHRLILRRTTGFPLESFLDDERIGMDSYMVLWWLARRLDGEPNLRLAEVEEDWPDDLGPDDLAAFVSDPDVGEVEGDNPEA